MGSDCLTFDAGSDRPTFDKGSVVELVDALDSGVCPVLKGSPNEKKCREYSEKTLYLCGLDGEPYRDSSSEQSIAISEGGDEGTHGTRWF